MRVVHLSTSDFGGAAVAAMNLHLALLEQGVDSDLLTLGRTRHDIPRHAQVDPFRLGGSGTINWLSYKFRRVLERTGVVEDRVDQPNNRYLRDRPPGFEHFSLPYSWFPILEHPLVARADVIHLHWVASGMVDYLGFFSNCRGKVVWTMHDMVPFTGGCHHADDCTGHLRSCEVCPQLRDPGKAHDYWGYKRRALSLFPMDRLQLVAPSRWLGDLASASSLMKGRPCEVIPNGFDRSCFRPMDRPALRAELGLPADGRIVLFNALDINNPRKGMHLLLPALDVLDQDVMLVCLGNSSGIPAAGRRVLETGYLRSPREIAKYFAAADLFVLPSLAENLPNTISESLLCGTPVVAFRVGGIPEQVGPSNGSLVDRKESPVLGAAIGQSLATRWDHHSIARDAAERYDRGRMAMNYRRVYGF